MAQALAYSAEQPLIFTQLAFWVFYAWVLLVFGAIHRRQRLRNVFLFAVSVFFYYKTSGFFFLILLFSTVTDFFIGKRIFSTTSDRGKKGWVAASITLNLLVLGYFKYAYFFTDSFNALMETDVAVYNHFAQWSNGFFGTAFRADRILLPVGISFFTFQTMSYALIWRVGAWVSSCNCQKMRMFSKVRARAYPNRRGDMRTIHEPLEVSQREMVKRGPKLP